MTKTMRKLMSSIAVVLTCAGVMPAQAAPASVGPYPVSGKVNGSCQMPSTAPLSFSTVVPANGKLDPALSNLRWTITGISCNTSSSISVSARSLRITNPRTSLNPSQSQAINYSATASGWASVDATVTTADATPLGTTTLYSGTARAQNTPKAGTVIVSVSNFVVSGTKGNSLNNAKPIDGTYNATIILTLAPIA